MISQGRSGSGSVLVEKRWIDGEYLIAPSSFDSVVGIQWLRKFHFGQYLPGSDNMRDRLGKEFFLALHAVSMDTDPWPLTRSWLTYRP